MAKILAVDDSKVILKNIQFSLDDTDHELTLAHDGEEALIIAKESSFDLVLTDLNMPNMGGMDLIKNLRQLANYKTTPILCITTESSQELIQKSREIGATGWIVKPFSPAKLIATIEKLV